MLPERIRLLDVDVNGSHSGRLAHASTFTFDYSRDDPGQPGVSLLMPASILHFDGGSALFPAMDMNLPEGYLFLQIRELFPKQVITPMHLLALMGNNGIGRLGYRLPDAPPPTFSSVVNKADLLSSGNGPALFQELMHAYLSTGAGISGIQPKIMVPDRATVPVPTLIVKMAAERYPGLSANEFMCLSAAREAGIHVAPFDLSADGSLLVIERFDIAPDASRLGFEDAASLMGQRVRDTLSDRKYHGSYERVVAALKLINLPDAELARFYEQVAFTAMVRNGDGHLKNFGVLYSGTDDVRLAPMFDVVTTSIYKYQRYDGGPELEDYTMALKLFAGPKGSKVYPSPADLLDFGRRVCGVSNPQAVIERIAQGMAQTLARCRNDPRISKQLHGQMSSAWEKGLLLAQEIARGA
ncbi:type II toxin-antitoxin system HipA family toxin [Polaromonas sp. CF318]|uniref:type II toxin-antitoxin system HipA family toxin n=1 Tax=Polaromonas sp. CF318 TaxID=1144318 RepID=UPI0002FA065F|nr:type II toxin-antitoxin system HipA family toxin [Polaromonas sp. CF318]